MSEEALTPGGQAKRGGSQHWCTPEWIVSMVRVVFDDLLDLDPFSNPGSITHAKDQWYGPEQDGMDGFELSWGALAETVYFNPPWNRTGDAVRKASQEWHDSDGEIQIIGLIPCSMNAKHWPLVERAPARCCLNRRPSFMVDGEIKKGNPKDVAIVYWGSRPYRFADVFSSVGRIYFGVIG
jgi:hypothetical protein